jgi:hypothetical protein
MPYTATWIAVKPVPLSGFPFESRLGAATLNVLNQDHHYCDDQKDRDKPAHRIRGDETKKSEDDQYDCNGIQHGVFHVGSTVGEKAPLTGPIPVSRFHSTRKHALAAPPARLRRYDHGGGGHHHHHDWH